MNCPKCGGRGPGQRVQSTITVASLDGDQIFRRRRCTLCGYHWRTIERSETPERSQRMTFTPVKAPKF